MLSHLLLFVAIFHPRCPWLGPLIRQFRTERKAVWLTIDDGPDAERSVQLAEELRARRCVPLSLSSGSAHCSNRKSFARSSQPGTRSPITVRPIPEAACGVSD